MSAGIRAPGVDQGGELYGRPAITDPDRAISVMLASSGSQPVVSTSTITNSSLASGRIVAAGGAATGSQVVIRSP